MARTIAEIKQEMTDAFMGESVVREKYGFSSTDTFDTRFSKVSIEGLLFYVVAFGVWVLEKLFDSHKKLPSLCLLCGFFASSFIPLETSLLEDYPTQNDNPLKISN